MSARSAAAVPTVARTGRGFGLYVHWPFCRSKCPYCDFNSHVADSIDHDAWRRALLAELNHAAGAEAPGIGPLTSIFFGGGTPTLMAPATAAAVIERASVLWGLSPGAEITLEGNPTSVEAGRLVEFRAAGINRVSLGVQALDDVSLRVLGREHSTEEALGAVRAAARLFDRYSFDLIYARPGQTAAAWEAELRHALVEARDHLSVYQLTIEKGTAFHTLHARGGLDVPDEETGATLYEITQDILEDSGLPGYEISNHAAPGSESRHNLTYWRYGDYVGVGPGAHGRITRDGVTVAFRRHRAPDIWLRRVAEAGHGTGAMTPVAEDERVAEILMMGLRTRDGVDRGEFHEITGRTIEQSVASSRLDDLAEEGLLVLDGAALRATAEGRQRLDALLAHLLA